MLRRRFSLGVFAMGCALAACDSNSSTFGSPTSSSASAEPTTSRGRHQIDSEIRVVPFDGAAVDQPAPYFGSQDASGAASQPRADFEPEVIHQEFCWAVSVINSRPQPRDEFQEVVVAGQYFAAIEPYVVADLRDELTLLIDFTAAVVDDGSFTETDEPVGESDVAMALETINEFVDSECLGLST